MIKAAGFEPGSTGAQSRIERKMGMLVQHVNRIANSLLIAEEVHRIQDEWGMALIEQRFQRILSNEVTLEDEL